MRLSALILISAMAAGCAGNSGAAKTGPASPLTVAEWKTLPVDEKYEPATIERLKKADPNLETPEGWDAFNRSTLLPARKMDFPNGQKKN